MHHIAIMDKSIANISDILSGAKTVESRWYLSRKAPWNKIKKGDIVYFKQTSEPVKARAEVQKIIQYDYLQPQKVREIIKIYSKSGKMALENTQKFYQENKNKKYCILIFIANPKPVKCFNIDRTGFGISSAWLCTDHIKKLRSS